MQAVSLDWCKEFKDNSHHRARHFRCRCPCYNRDKL